MKYCTYCKIIITVDNKSTANSFCKKCIKIYKKEYYSKNLASSKAASKKAKLKRKKYYLCLKNKPCTDCKKTYHYSIMDFDHLDSYTKTKKVSTLKCNSSKKSILDEINKCEIVCSNCHRKRTYLRKQKKPEIFSENKKAIYSKKRREKLKKFVIEKKELLGNKCIKCKEVFEFYQLDFHHLNDKKHNVSNLLNFSEKTISEEIAKCELMCSNCHRYETYLENTNSKST